MPQRRLDPRGQGSQVAAGGGHGAVAATAVWRLPLAQNCNLSGVIERVGTRRRDQWGHPGYHKGARQVPRRLSQGGEGRAGANGATLVFERTFKTASPRFEEHPQHPKAHSKHTHNPGTVAVWRNGGPAEWREPLGKKGGGEEAGPLARLSRSLSLSRCLSSVLRPAGASRSARRAIASPSSRCPRRLARAETLGHGQLNAES